MESAESFDFFGIGVDHPGAARVTELAGGDPAACDPAEEGDAGHADGAGEVGQPPLVLAELLPFSQRVLSVLLQFPYHQTVFGLGQLVLPTGPFGCVVGALQALTPDPVYLGPVPLSLLGGLKRDVQRGWGHRRHQQGGHIPVDAGPGQLLAQLAPVVGLGPAALIDPAQPSTRAALSLPS
ncbi:hypothetical protein ACFV80_46345 [Streptomyces sp. NPDC059862]|uniref:hypothetical protein n=1 Tax=Streptomyces sp. NPDC059862 TaxID=3346975 RepID=UPI00365FC0BE